MGLFSPPQKNHAGQQNQKANKKQHFKNLQIFQIDIQANIIKWWILSSDQTRNKNGKWTDYQNFTCDDAMFFPFLNLFSLDLQEPQIRNTTQRRWNLTNSVTIKHFLYPYKVCSDYIVILCYGTGTFFVFSLSEAIWAFWHKSGIVCIMCFWYSAILWCILWLNALHSKLVI